MPTNTSVPAPTLILRQAECLADSVIFMYLGELIELGPANEIFNSPREERTREYLAGAIGTCSQPASDQLPLVTGE